MQRLALPYFAYLLSDSCAFCFCLLPPRILWHCSSAAAKGEEPRCTALLFLPLGCVRFAMPRSESDDLMCSANDRARRAGQVLMDEVRRGFWADA